MANCSAFPATITTGDTIVPGVFGAVLCNGTMPNFCRASNNTYSDACGGNDDFFLSQNSMTGARQLYVRDQQEWVLVSKTHGDDTGSVGYAFSQFPADTDVTFVFRAGATEYEFIFRFVGDTIIFRKFAPR